MRVRRTLPQRQRSLIGAWCFVDHYGPDEVDETGGMVLPAHPHTGLQTASWLFDGELEHRDSVGSRATVRPGELNLMTAGRGISHTEVSTPGTTTLHGAQLWIALPDGSRHVEPRFEHFAPEPVRGPGWEARAGPGVVEGVTRLIELGGTGARRSGVGASAGAVPSTRTPRTAAPTAPPPMAAIPVRPRERCAEEAPSAR